MNISPNRIITTNVISTFKETNAHKKNIDIVNALIVPIHTSTLHVMTATIKITLAHLLAKNIYQLSDIIIHAGSLVSVVDKRENDITMIIKTLNGTLPIHGIITNYDIITPQSKSREFNGMLWHIANNKIEVMYNQPYVPGNKILEDISDYFSMYDIFHNQTNILKPIDILRSYYDYVKDISIIDANVGNDLLYYYIDIHGIGSTNDKIEIENAW